MQSHCWATFKKIRFVLISTIFQHVFHRAFSLQNYAGIPFTHLASEMPAAYKKLKIPPRGVSNRRAALKWIRRNVKQGVSHILDE